MEYALQNAAPQPTLQHTVADPDGRQVRVITFSGVVAVAPAQQRGIVVRTTVEQPGAPVGFYVPEAFGVPLADAVAVVQATPTQVVIDGRTRRRTASATRRCASSSRSRRPESAGRTSASRATPTTCRSACTTA
jgi:hypothetical protein